MGHWHFSDYWRSYQATVSFLLYPSRIFLFLHALTPVKTKESLSNLMDWTNEIMNQMKRAELVKAKYLEIMGLDQSVQDCFENEKFERLKGLNRKVDPGNVFKNVPAQCNFLALY
jgi:hypothetical protein